MNLDATPWEALLTRLKRGPSDPSAWSELCRRVKSYASAALERASDAGVESAEDVSQQLLLKLLESDELLEHLDEDGPLDGYFRTAVRHAVADIIRRRVLSVRVLKELAGQRTRSDEVRSSDFSARAWIDCEMARLPDLDRQLLRMRYWENRDVSEIATALDMNASTVAVRLYRIIGALRSRARQTSRH